MIYVAFYEYWPFNYAKALENIILGIGFNFVYIEKGFYKFIEDFDMYMYNLAGWLAVTALIFALAITVISVRFLRHEFKHSKTLLKKWSFNAGELLFIPIFFNLIPMLTCFHTTIKNGYSLHECDKYEAQYILFVVGVIMVVIGVLYNLGLIFMIRKRKISYRQRDHDGFLKRKELEYILEISDSWRKQSFFLFSSYKGTKLRMYFKPVFNIFILFLICTHAYGERDPYTKAMIYSISFTVAALFMLAVRPFRCASSNFLLFFMFMHLCGPLYMVTQEINGMRHGLLTNKYFSICLYIMLGIFLSIQILIVSLCLILKAKWPMNIKRIRDTVYRHERILEMMQQAFTIITKLRLKKVDTKKENLEEIVELLTDEYNLAFAEEHPFQYSVLELIDELKDTAVVIDDRKQKQEYHFMADFLEIIDDKKSYL